MIETSEDHPILIAGGGIGGLAAALALAQKGAHVRVLEQAPEFKEIGAGLQLGPNVFKMFARLGLSESIFRAAVFPENLIFKDAISGETVTRIALDENFLARFHYPYAVIHRADLHRVLLDAARALPLIALGPSQSVTSFHDDGKAVAVTVKEGAVHRGRCLIGADGLWSTIRAAIVGDGPPRRSGHICYRAVLPAPEMPAHLRLPSMVLWAGEKTHLVHYPLRGGELYNLVAVFHSDRYEEGWDSYGDPAELQRRFAGTHPDMRALLGKIGHWRMWVLCDREPVKEWSSGRVALLGDAAHPTLQYLAQGASMAIEDAVVLADCLDGGQPVEHAFAAYAQARFFRTGRVQLTARLYGEFFHASGVKRELRNILLRERTREQGIESMAWLYDGI